MKTLLFIQSIMERDWERLHTLCIVLVVLYSCVIAAAGIDLFFGVRRAKRLEIVRTSYGFRRTITKLTSYLGLMMMLSFADVAASIVLHVPYFTVVGAVGVIAVELKSVYENIRSENAEVEEIPKFLLQILKDKESVKEVINFIKSSEKNEFK